VADSSINRYLVIDKTVAPPGDGNKFRISRKDFQHLISQFEIPPTFVSAIANPQIPQGCGSRQNMFFYDPAIFDFWYILPVRLQVRCIDQTQGHTSSAAGKSQMNPQYYLHLPEQKLDIRGSQIAVYFQYNRRSHSSSIVVLNFLDGRWPKLVEEPRRRVEECLSRAKSIRTSDDPFFVHVIYLTNVVQWWLNVLSSFKDQLIAHVRNERFCKSPANVNTGYESSKRIRIDSPSNTSFQQRNQQGAPLHGRPLASLWLGTRVFG